ncbi:MAG: AMP-binding protein, partial [Burkholderiales bacterium]
CLKRSGDPADRITRDFFAAFWACILGGITPVSVAVAPRYDAENSVVLKLVNTWRSLGCPCIVASETLMAPLSGVLGQMARTKLLSVAKLRAYSPAQSMAQVSSDETAFFQLPSGSTGVPKCIQETHRGVISHIRASRRFNGYQSSDVSLNWFAMDHVVPLLTYHLKDVYLGCQQIQAPLTSILEDPLTWLDLIDRHGVTHTWSPNFGYKLLSDARSSRACARNLKSMRHYARYSRRRQSRV